LAAQLIGERLITTGGCGYQDLAAALAKAPCMRCFRQSLITYALCALPCASMAFLSRDCRLVPKPNQGPGARAWRALIAANLACFNEAWYAGCYRN